MAQMIRSSVKSYRGAMTKGWGMKPWQVAAVAAAALGYLAIGAAAPAAAANYELCVSGGTDFINRVVNVQIGTQTFSFTGGPSGLGLQCQQSTATGMVRAGTTGLVTCRPPSPDITADRTARLTIMVDERMSDDVRPRPIVVCWR